MLRLDPQDQDALKIVGSESRTRDDGAPWVLLNMVASIDGATAIDGVSGGLGGPADKQMFGAIRSLPDVILVGAATVRAERYNPPLRPKPEAAQMRADRGQAERPRICVLTNSLRLETDLAFLSDDPKPLVATNAEAQATAERALASRVEFLDTGATFTVNSTVAALADLGSTVVLCEGGPSLNAQMLAADLIDEILLTVAPVGVGGDSRRITHGATPEAPIGFHLDRAMTEDDFLFLRYVRRPA
jgi:riboflavin biosynthesis pyrimidine reductase